MEKINYDSFKEYIRKVEGKTIVVDIRTMVQTIIKIERASVKIDNYDVTIFNKENKKVKIDINYIANFYTNNKTLVLELDQIGNIILEII